MVRRWPTLVVLAFVWIGLCVVAAALALRLAPIDYQALDLRARLAPPMLFGGTWHHVLGTDEVGHDVFSRLLASIRVSLSVAFAGTLIGSTLGTTLGFLAARHRGWLDDAVMMLADAQAAIPFIIVALTIIAFFRHLIGVVRCGRRALWLADLCAPGPRHGTVDDAAGLRASRGGTGRPADADLSAPRAAQCRGRADRQRYNRLPRGDPAGDRAEFPWVSASSRRCPAWAAC